MRIIDADALLKNFENLCMEECCCCKEASVKMTRIGNVTCRTFDHCGLIDTTPTIDAIPVEWMREKMRGYASALKSTETAALVMVMQMWQKEQEAR